MTKGQWAVLSKHETLVTLNYFFLYNLCDLKIIKLVYFLLNNL